MLKILLTWIIATILATGAFTAEDSKPVSLEFRLVLETASTDSEKLSMSKPGPAGMTDTFDVNVQKTVLMDQSALKSVEVNHETVTDRAAKFRTSLLLEFNAAGAAQFAELTRAHKGEEIAIVANGKVLAAPRIRGEVTDGKVLITGALTLEEAVALAARLNAAVKK